MKEQVAEIASGKAAWTTMAAAGSTPVWIEFINGETFQAIAALTAFLLALTLIIVNAALLPYRLKNARAEAALKRHQLKQAGVDTEQT